MSMLYALIPNIPLINVNVRPMDSSTTINQDKLERYMVNFNPMADRFMAK